MTDFTKLVPAPARHEVNTGVEPCPTSLLASKYGLPRQTLTDQCQPATDAFWKSRMATMDLGPFKATGFKPFLELIKAKLEIVRVKNPELYQSLGTAGCLCIRHVRGNKRIPSNHCFGMAIDFKIGGKIDPRGDDMVQIGMLELWKLIKGPDLYWGVEFRVEDAMHIEASRSTVMRWIAAGFLK